MKKYISLLGVGLLSLVVISPVFAQSVSASTAASTKQEIIQLITQLLQQLEAELQTLLGQQGSTQTTTTTTSTQPSITVISPTAGSQLTAGQTYNITWTSSNLLCPNISINLLSNNTSVKTIANAISNSGNYSWIVDSSIPSGSYSVAVGNCGALSPGGEVGAQSGIFSIISGTPTSVAPTITSISPNTAYVDSTKFGMGSSITVYGTGFSVNGGIEIHLLNASTGAVITDVSTNNPSGEPTSDTQFSFSVPNSTLPGQYNVEVENIYGLKSNQYPFTVSGSTQNQTPSITITSPNGGENLIKGNTYNITWNASPAFNSAYSQVRITLVAGNEDQAVIPDQSVTTNNTGSYTWNIPNVSLSAYIQNYSGGPYTLKNVDNQNQFKFLIEGYPPQSMMAEGPFDYSDNYFTISNPGQNQSSTNPPIYSLSTTTVPFNGSTNITITGSGFNGSTAIYINGLTGQKITPTSVSSNGTTLTFTVSNLGASYGYGNVSVGVSNDGVSINNLLYLSVLTPTQCKYSC